MVKEKTPKPWERQPDETPKPFEAFCVYRDMGTERSLSRVAEKLQKSDTLMGRWSSKYRWVERATAWDDERERVDRDIAQKEQAKAIKEMRKRHADIATSLLVKAAQALLKLPAEDIKPADIKGFVEAGAKLERISRGDVGEVIEERDGSTTIPAVQFYMPENGRDKKEEEDTP